VTNLKAKDGLAIYFQRMKIEESFRDLKSLLNLHKLMNKRRTLMEKMVALVLGEILREHLFPLKSRKHKLFLGPFLFLKLKPELAPPVLAQALSAFSLTVCPVRTYI
jgi:hypothetical protein